MTTETTPAPRPRAKRLVGMVLAILAVGAVAYGLVREAARSRLVDESRATSAEVQPTSAPGGSSAPAAALVTTVYYFHGETRCDTCRSIEQQTTEIVRTTFAEEIAAGSLRFLAVNYDAPEHRHFRDDFDLSFGSVVVSRGTRYENLSDVWTLVDEEPRQFDAYVVEHVAAFMKAAP